MIFNNVKEKLPVIGWVMYDWANSAFATTVLVAFFPIMFRKYWAGGDFATAKLGIGNSIAGILIALISPLLGAIGDFGNKRNKFFATFVMLGALMTALLPFVAQGSWFVALLCFILANFGWASANLFYDSLLPTVAKPKKIDIVSSVGYSVGYLGGGLLFLLNIQMVNNPSAFGLADKVQAIKVSFWSVAVWWLIFSVPILLFVKDSKKERKQNWLIVLKEGIFRLKNTFGHIRQLKNIWMFLIAYWLYIDGADTFTRMAADLGLSIGLKSGDLMVSLLIVQLIAFPFALLFGLLAQKIGAIRSIKIAIGIYVFVSVLGPIWVRVQWQYTFLAGVTAVPLGALQALSRSYYARIIPVGKSAEFFGFYNLMGKFAVIIGPALVAVVAIIVEMVGGSSENASRIGFSSIALLFIVGALFLNIATDKK